MPLSGFGESMHTKIRELIYGIKRTAVTNATVRQFLVLAQDAGWWVQVQGRTEKS